jgi:hypothetical protein
MKTELIHNPHLTVKKSTVHGLCVFAETDFSEGEILEEFYSLRGDVYSVHVPMLKDYIFGLEDEIKLLPLGFGSIYNHSDKPNARYIIHTDEPIVTFKALKPIKKGEELFVYYGQDWFSSRGIKEISYKALLAKRRLKSFMAMSIRFGLIVGILYSALYLFA